MTSAPAWTPGRSWRRVALAIGPGLVVMLADTGAGSVVTAAQSGAEWGYRLLPLQFAMIPLLFVIQELTVRLAFGAGRGFAELVQRRYGRSVAVAVLVTLAASCFGALVTQLSALGGLAQALGAPVAPTVTASVLFFISVAGFGAYGRVERVAIALGLFELAFVAVAWRAGPKAADVARQMFDAPLRDTRYLYLLAANIGTTFLPWAAFYQQSAILDKALTPQRLREARLETLGGAILCQLITAAILVAGAATAGHGVGGGSFADIGALARTFGQALGTRVGTIVFALGLCGSAMVAAMVAGLTVGWSFSEVFAVRPKPGASPRTAPGFFLAYVVMMLAAGAFVVSGANPVTISIAAGAVNAVLLPVTLALLYGLARTQLNGALAMSPRYARELAAAFAILSVICVYAGLRGLIG